MSQGGGSMPSGSPDPYQGTSRVLLNNTTTPDKVFGSAMPEAQIDNAPTAQQIYGNENYVNPSLQGYSQTGQNIVNVDRLNSTSPVTPEQIERLRRQEAIATPPTPQSLPNTTFATPTSSSTQLYMQPPTVPQISDIQPTTQTYHDLSTAEGSLDYLNAIAPATQDKRRFNLPVNNKLFVGVGISMITLVIVVAVVGALGNTSGKLGKATANLGKSLANLQKIVDYGEKNADYASDDLNKLTAETNLIMTSHQTTLGGLVTLGTVNDKGKTEEVEADATVTERLDNAKATGHFDDEYQSELNDRLTAVSNDLATAYNATKNETIRNALDSGYRDAQILLNRITSTSS